MKDEEVNSLLEAFLEREPSDGAELLDSRLAQMLERGLPGEDSELREALLGDGVAEADVAAFTVLSEGARQRIATRLYSMGDAERKSESPPSPSLLESFRAWLVSFRYQLTGLAVTAAVLGGLILRSPAISQLGSRGVVASAQVPGDHWTRTEVVGRDDIRSAAGSEALPVFWSTDTIRVELTAEREPESEVEILSYIESTDNPPCVVEPRVDPFSASVVDVAVALTDCPLRQGVHRLVVAVGSAGPHPSTSELADTLRPGADTLPGWQVLEPVVFVLAAAP